MRLQSPGGVTGVGDSISRVGGRPQFITMWTFSARLLEQPHNTAASCLQSKRCQWKWGESQVSCMSWPWKLHTIIYIISYWLHRSFPLSMRGITQGHAYQEAEIIEGHLFFFGCATWHEGSWFPDQGLNPCSLQWKQGVLTTPREFLTGGHLEDWLP